MLVYQAMSTHVVAARPEESALEVARELIERGITGLPVVDADGHVVGLVSELDLLRAVRDGIDPAQVTVEAVMDRRPLFVGPDTDLFIAIDLMDEWQVRRLPVCVGSRLVGIISRRDILAMLTDDDRPALSLVPVGSRGQIHARTAW